MTADPTDIRNFQRLDDRITTSGRLREEDLDSLAAIGVLHVINLALDEHPEALADEAEKLSARGIGYTHIPVPFDAPGEDHYRRFVDTLRTAEGQPVHVHCIMNYRVSAFFYRHHVENRAMPEDKARTLLERQWAPHKSTEPMAAPWAEFLSRTRASAQNRDARRVNARLTLPPARSNQSGNQEHNGLPVVPVSRRP